MAFRVGYCSCPRLCARQVTQVHNAPSRTARVIVRPGVHETAAAAGEVAISGQLADVQHLTSDDAAVVQQLHHLENEQQLHIQQQRHALLPTDAATSSNVVPLCNGNHDASQYSHWAHVQHNSSCVAASAQLQLLPSHADAAQQRQQLLHAEQLNSNSSASPSSSDDGSIDHCTARPPRLRNQHHHHVDSLDRSSWSSSSSNGHSQHALQDSTHVQQQQQPSLQEPSQSSSSSNSRQNSISSRLPSGLQLVRPLEGPSTAGARACSPAQLAAVSDALRITVADAQKLLHKHPQLITQQPAAIHEAVQQLATTLSISYDSAAYMCQRQPAQLLLRSATEVQQSVIQLSTALQLPSQQQVAAAAASAPALLSRPLPGVVKRLQCVCAWFSVSPAEALRMVAAAPELLSDSAPSIQKRAQALGSILKLKPVCVQRMVAACPSVLFMSPRIMNNKLKVLMAIMHKDARIIGKDIVYKTPQLLRRNLEKVRICYQLLPIVLQRHEGFVFAMSAHNGRLLLLPAAKLLVRGARLQAALQMVPEWQQQWQQLRPPQVEQGFAANYSRFERLEYLISTQQSSSIGLLEALRLPTVAFRQQYSSWDGWWDAKQQRLQQQQQQRWQVQQQQWRRQQAPQLGYAAGFQVHPGPPEQQQLQQQYQQALHQQLRRLQHLHRQRQLQLQQHRALVLQQRALQWQQVQKQLQQQQQLMRLQQQQQQRQDDVWVHGQQQQQGLLDWQQQQQQQTSHAGSNHNSEWQADREAQQEVLQQQMLQQHRPCQLHTQQQQQHDRQCRSNMQQQQPHFNRQDATQQPPADVPAAVQVGLSSNSTALQQPDRVHIPAASTTPLGTAALPDSSRGQDDLLLQQEHDHEQLPASDDAITSSSGSSGPESSSSSSTVGVQDHVVAPQQRMKPTLQRSNVGGRYLTRQQSGVRSSVYQSQQGSSSQLWQPVAAAASGFDKS